MGMSRRSFLHSVAAAAALMPLAARAVPAPAHTLRYFSARADGAGRFYLSGFDADGALGFDVPLPARGHGVAIHPSRPEVVAVARRPGRYLLVVDAVTGAVRHRLESAPGRHFYGHGLFSADGTRLFTSENDYANGSGVIGVRDAADGYRPLGEFASHGIGPHDLRLLSDGHTLVVANGGILTHPDTPRAKLNLDTMSPSLAYLDSRTGALLEAVRLPEKWHQNSIRHLAVTADDRVCFVNQFEGSRRERPPLVGLHRRGEEPTLCLAPDAIQARLRNYCGSAAVDASGRWFGVSSPRGGLVTFWEAASGAFAGHTDLPDGCGVAAGTRPGEFLLSSGRGEVYRFDLATGTREALSPATTTDPRWDNHMAQVVLSRGG